MSNVRPDPEILDPEILDPEILDPEILVTPKFYAYSHAWVRQQQVCCQHCRALQAGILAPACTHPVLNKGQNHRISLTRTFLTTLFDQDKFEFVYEMNIPSQAPLLRMQTLIPVKSSTHEAVIRE